MKIGHSGNNEKETPEGAESSRIVFNIESWIQLRTDQGPHNSSLGAAPATRREKQSDGTYREIWTMTGETRAWGRGC